MSKGIRWEVRDAEMVKVAKLGKREYQVAMRPATEELPFVRFSLIGARGGRYQALPTLTEGVYQVLSTQGANFMGYAKIVDGVMVDAPEYR